MSKTHNKKMQISKEFEASAQHELQCEIKKVAFLSYVFNNKVTKTHAQIILHINQFNFITHVIFHILFVKNANIACCLSAIMPVT